jgi:hypothetical protein
VAPKILPEKLYTVAKVCACADRRRMNVDANSIANTSAIDHFELMPIRPL